MKTNIHRLHKAIKSTTWRNYTQQQKTVRGNDDINCRKELQYGYTIYYTKKSNSTFS